MPTARGPHGRVTTAPSNGTGYSRVTTASTNAALVSAEATTLTEVTVSNVTATATYVKLYNKATAPTVGTDVPLVTIPCPANATQVLTFGAQGKRFGTGLGVAATAAIGATDSANAVVGVQISATYVV